MQKQAEEMSKTNPPAKMDVKKKMAEMQAQAKEEEARQEQEEKREKEKLQAALKLQLAAPGPPQFTATSSLTKKIVEDEVRLIQTGTSTLTPNALLDAWKAAIAGKPLNDFSNDISNGSVTTRLFVSMRIGDQEKVTLEARREAGGKITRIEIYYTLPKPSIDSDQSD